MKPSHLPVTGLLVAFVLFGLGTPCVLAYPPAPHHVIYGVVRDEMGRPLTSATAQVVLEASSGTLIATRINPLLGEGINYSLTIPMDAGLTVDLYRPTALRPFVPFQLKVRIGAVQYLPMEMVGDYSTLGLPGGKTRLDLTLGEDTDGDGLPDAWERWLIAQLGGNLTLADIGPDDDPDGDGLSNRMEYLAGTHAYDGEHTFALSVVQTGAHTATLEFMTITGRTYTVEVGDQLGGWMPGPFQPVGAPSPVTEYLATDIRVLQVEVALPEAAASARFFRLRVQ